MIATRERANALRRLAGPICLLALVGCSSGAGTEPDDTIPMCAPTVAPPPPAPPDDKLSPTRVLRRISLALSGRVPTIEAYEALMKAPDPEVVLQKAIDDGLASTEFYEHMVDFGHQWITNGAFTTGAQGDGYSGNMSAHMGQCPDTSLHPGAWFVYQESPGSGNFCDDLDEMGNPSPAPLEVTEPWWAPGTQVTVVGWATRKDLEIDIGDGTMASCASASTLYFNAGSVPGCGCGPNLVWCYPGSGLGSTSSLDDKHQRRHVWDEPARLVAHLAWHDRPLSDLVTGNYTVANNMVRAEYLRLARRTGAYPELDANTTWWKPSLDKGPRDPMHTDPNDPWAWRELVVEELAPFLLAANPDKSKTPSGDLARTFTWDPREQTTASPGIAAAGVLTMPGVNSSFARERPRAARFLEIFACQKFTPPPPELNLGAPGLDIATSGTCQHCHRLMDPVAVAFKRWDFDNSNYIPLAMLIDVGPWEVTAEHTAGIYPYNGGPFTRWTGSWIPGTVLTPVTEADVAKNPGVLALDTIPTEYEILGAHPDGTSGPLGFGKVLVTSGAFDRCATQRLYERFMGRPLNPELESLYIAALTDEFVKGGRKVKPFVRSLLAKPEFRRGL